MKSIHKLVYAFFLLAVLLVNAQPPNPGGGVGGTTPGAVASPIDMYVYGLAIIAMLFIVFFTKKSKSQKA